MIGGYDKMMTIAKTEAQASVVGVPAAGMVATMFSLSTGDAKVVKDAGDKWGEAADHLETAMNDLRDSVSAISQDDWGSQDREAYQQKVEELCSQLEAAVMFLQSVSIALTVYAYAMLTYAAFAVGMGTFLAALAATALAAKAAYAAFGAGAAVDAQCQALAATCVTITGVATGVLAAAAQIAGTVFQGGAALSAFVQDKRGNENAMGDLKDAQMQALPAMGANLAESGANAALDVTTRGQNSALDSIDLDADRDHEGDYHLGGGAAFETAGGHKGDFEGHVQYGDDGFAGADLEGSYENPNGVGVNAKGDYDHRTGDWSAEAGAQYTSGDNEYSGTVGYERKDGEGTITGEAGYQNQTTGTEASVSGQYNHTTGDYEASASGSYNNYSANAGYNSDGTITAGGGYGYQNASGAGVDGGGEVTYNHNTGEWGGDVNATPNVDGSQIRDGFNQGVQEGVEERAGERIPTGASTADETPPWDR